MVGQAVVWGHMVFCEGVGREVVTRNLEELIDFCKRSDLPLVTGTSGGGEDHLLVPTEVMNILSRIR